MGALSFQLGLHFVVCFGCTPERTEHTAAGDGVGKAGNDRKPVSALSQFLQARGAEAVRYSPPQSSSFYPESGSVEKGSARLRHEASTQGYEATFTPQDDDDEVCTQMLVLQYLKSASFHEFVYTY